MRIKSLLLSAVLVLACGSSFSAIVDFNGAPASTFADGTFSQNLGPQYADGFYNDGANTAYNGYGQNHETIYFNSSATLNSLAIQNWGSGYGPTTLTINVFDAFDTLLTSQAANLDGSFHSMIFGTNNVRSVSFDFTGGTNYYGDGRMVAWYVVKDVDYTMGSVTAVPEPETYALMLAGLGMVGAIVRRRRAKHA